MAHHHEPHVVRGAHSDKHTPLGYYITRNWVINTGPRFAGAVKSKRLRAEHVILMRNQINAYIILMEEPLGKPLLNIDKKKGVCH
jgi:hypothetical protein